MNNGNNHRSNDNFEETTPQLGLNLTRITEQNQEESERKKISSKSKHLNSMSIFSSKNQKKKVKRRKIRNQKNQELKKRRLKRWEELLGINSINSPGEKEFDLQKVNGKYFRSETKYSPKNHRSTIFMTEKAKNLRTKKSKRKKNLADKIIEKRLKNIRKGRSHTKSSLILDKQEVEIGNLVSKLKLPYLDHKFTLKKKRKKSRRSDRSDFSKHLLNRSKELAREQRRRARSKESSKVEISQRKNRNRTLELKRNIKMKGGGTGKKKFRKKIIRYESKDNDPSLLSILNPYSIQLRKLKINNDYEVVHGLYKKKMESYKIPQLSNDLNCANYYMVDLRNYYFADKNTTSSRNFKTHFNEIFEVLRNYENFEVLEENEILDKMVPFSEEENLFDTKILVLDMDETLLHTQFMVDKDEETIEMMMNDGKVFHVKIILNYHFKFENLGKNSIETLSLSIFGKYDETLHIDLVYRE